jgi:hypothetical protein
MASQLGDSHDNLKKGVDPHHKRLTELDQQIATLEQERALVKISAIRELQATLKLTPELIGHLVAGCR